MADAYPRRVYLLSPRRLSQETIAVTFAKTSRSPLSFSEIADELSDAKSSEFHEKWVVGYGHASVAEHAVLHIAYENVSRLAVEAIESSRLASYTEKSTRYQRWEPGSYHIPTEVAGGPHESLYRQTCDLLFDAYARSLSPVRRIVQAETPRQDGETDDTWDGRIRSRYVDACRYLLPMAALANVGMTANARTLANALGKMLGHPLAEVREIGRALRDTARHETPTLLKYADPSSYRVAVETRLAERGASLPRDDSRRLLTLLAHDPDGEERVLAAAVYSHAGLSFERSLEHVRSLDAGARRRLAEDLFEGRGRFDVPPRALEHSAYTFEAVLDQGAYFELKRHRLISMTPQRLTTRLGFAVPRLITRAGFEPEYRAALARAVEAFERLDSWNPAVAAYVVPNAFNRRVAMTLNLREVYHLCELRSAPNAHFAMRRLALRMAEAVRQVHPLLASPLKLPSEVDGQAIELEGFSQV
jgi:thymidylate synthase ThyX